MIIVSWPFYYKKLALVVHVVYIPLCIIILHKLATRRSVERERGLCKCLCLDFSRNQRRMMNPWARGMMAMLAILIRSPLPQLILSMRRVANARSPLHTVHRAGAVYGFLVCLRKIGGRRRVETRAYPSLVGGCEVGGYANAKKRGDGARHRRS